MSQLVCLGGAACQILLQVPTVKKKPVKPGIHEHHKKNCTCDGTWAYQQPRHGRSAYDTIDTEAYVENLQYRGEYVSVKTMCSPCKCTDSLQNVVRPYCAPVTKAWLYRRVHVLDLSACSPYKAPLKCKCNNS